MSGATMKDRIRRAWPVLDAACDSSVELSQWLREAFEAACDGERTHRRMGAGLSSSRYKLSIDAAARAIVLSWVSRKAPKTISWSNVAATRHDVALAYAIQEKLPPEKLAAIRLLGFATFDYSKDAVAPEKG